MGLRINTNINALIAMRHLSVNDRNQSASLERLSTGLRINRAADDPSGLVISDILRAQVRSLEQAVENSQNAFNLISVADSAMQEVSNLLIAIQRSILFALNTGGVSPAQIAAEQDAIDQAVAAIDRIAATTRFGNKDLLNGSLGFPLVGDRPDELDDLRIRSVAFQAGEDQRTLSLTISRNPQRAQIRILSAYSVGTLVLRVSGPRGTDDVTIASGTLSDGFARAINSIAGFTGVFASGTTGAGHRVDLFSEGFGATQLIRIEVIEGTVSGSTSTVQVLGDDGAMTTTGISQKPLTFGQIVADWGLDGQVLFENQLFTGVGREFSILSRVANLEFKLDPEMIPFASGTQVSFDVAFGGMSFQLGDAPTQSDRLIMGIESTGASRLGFEEFRDRVAEAIRGVSVGAPSTEYTLTGGFLNTIVTGKGNDLLNNPENALNITRAAINQIATIRGYLGAIQAQNILPNIDSVNVAIENLQSTLSAIRDLNFAEEASNFVKQQVLFQSNIGVLAAANGLPQAVLTLLGG